MASTIRFDPESGVVIACVGDVPRVEDAKAGAQEMWRNAYMPPHSTRAKRINGPSRRRRQ